jgi:hypothetical protein
VNAVARSKGWQKIGSLGGDAGTLLAQSGSLDRSASRTPRGSGTGEGSEEGAPAGARTLEGMREVGVLLIAFAPLEAALSGEPIFHHVRFLLVFLGGGFVLFGLSLLLEWRIDDVE